MSAARLAPAARGTIARAIAEAGGREVAFVADVAPDGTVTAAEVVARGTAESVLALAGVAGRDRSRLIALPLNCSTSFDWGLSNAFATIAITRAV